MPCQRAPISRVLEGDFNPNSTIKVSRADSIRCYGKDIHTHFPPTPATLNLEVKCVPDRHGNQATENGNRQRYNKQEKKRIVS